MQWSQCLVGNLQQWLHVLNKKIQNQSLACNLENQRKNKLNSKQAGEKNLKQRPNWKKKINREKLELSKDTSSKDQ